jgi:hypothetical protein
MSCLLAKNVIGLTRSKVIAGDNGPMEKRDKMKIKQL